MFSLAFDNEQLNKWNEQKNERMNEIAKAYEMLLKYFVP